MPVNDGVITGPLNTRDVAICIGEGSDDIGTLVVSNKINKWSKYKPVRYNTWYILTDAQLASTNFGLEIPVGNSDPAIAITGSYTYLKPRIGIDKLRLTDFNGYNHNYMAPCVGVGDITVNTVESSTAMISFMYSMNFEGITMSSFEILQDKYLACVFTYYKGTSTYKYTAVKTSSKPISEGASNIFTFDIKTEAPFNVPDARDITYYFLAAKNKVSIGDLVPPNTYYALPFKEDKPGTGNLIIKQSISMTMYLTHVATDPTTAVGMSITLFSGLVLPGQGLYYGVSTPGDFYVSGTIVNEGDTTIELYRYMMKMWSIRTFGVQEGSTDNGTGYITPDIWLKDATGTWYSGTETIKIGAGKTMDIRFGLPRFLSYDEGVPRSFFRYQKKEIYIEITHNGKFIGGTPMFRVQST